MSTPAIIQLQEYATDEQHNISALLRKALLVATKLKLSDFREWLSSELDGYHDAKLLPEYRIISGQLKVEDEYNGLIPYIIRNQEREEKISRINVYDSVSSLNDLIVEYDKSNDSVIAYPLASWAGAALMKNQGFEPRPVVRIAGKNQLISIISTIRTRILKWSLALEEEGILGEGLTFSSQEKKIAEKSMTINNIENFQGVLGSVSESTVTQTNHLVVNSGDFSSLAEYLRSQGVANQDIEELQQAVTNDPAPTQPNTLGANVSAWMGKMVAKAADGSWNVGVAASGGLLANALGKYYGLL